MDNTRGDFLEISNEQYEKQMEQENPMVFKVGEILEVRGSRLRIERIDRRKLTLKLLPQTKKQ